jgi:hypothetical protein
LAHVQRAMQGASYTLIRNTGDKEKLTKEYDQINGFRSSYMKILKNRSKLELLIEIARQIPIEIHGQRLRAQHFRVDPSGMVMEYFNAGSHASIFISNEDQYVFLMHRLMSRDFLVITAADPVGLIGGVRQETIPVSQGEAPRNAQNVPSRKYHFPPPQPHPPRRNLGDPDRLYV